MLKLVHGLLYENIPLFNLFSIWCAHKIGETPVFINDVSSPNSKLAFWCVLTSICGGLLHVAIELVKLVVCCLPKFGTCAEVPFYLYLSKTLVWKYLSWWIILSVILLLIFFVGHLYLLFESRIVYLKDAHWAFTSTKSSVFNWLNMRLLLKAEL